MSITVQQAQTLVSSYLQEGVLEEFYTEPVRVQIARTIVSRVVGALSDNDTKWGLRDRSISSAIKCVPEFHLSSETVCRDNQKKEMDFFEESAPDESDFLLLLDMLVEAYKPPKVDVAGQEMKDETKYVPAVSQSLINRMAETHWSKKRKLVPVTVGYEIRQRERKVATAEVLIRPELFQASKSLTSHRLFRWLVTKGSEQFHAKMPRYMDILLPGGFKQLCGELGIGYDGETVKKLVETLNFYQLAQIALERAKYFGLLLWEYRSNPNGGPDMLFLRLSDALLPHYVTHLSRDTMSDREARKLVPIPRELPPLIGTNVHLYAQQASLQTFIFSEFRNQAKVLAEHSTVHFDEMAFLRLAANSELPVPVVKEIMGAWSEGPDAWLTKHENDRYGLSSRMQKEKDVIVEAALLREKWKKRSMVTKKLATQRNNS